MIFAVFDVLLSTRRR